MQHPDSQRNVLYLLAFIIIKIIIITKFIWHTNSIKLESEALFNFLMPKVFMLEPAENHLNKIGSRLLRVSWVANSGKKLCKWDNNKWKINYSINESVSFVTHNTRKCTKRTFIWCDRLRAYTCYSCTKTQLHSTVVSDKWYQFL